MPAKPLKTGIQTFGNRCDPTHDLVSWGKAENQLVKLKKKNVSC